jgi:two-component system sensor histidine kinase CpxA
MLGSIQIISDVSHELRLPGEMLGRLLTIARLDASSATIEMKLMTSSSLVAEIVEDAQLEAHARDRSIQLSSTHEIYVRGNLDLLRSAFENIIRNACRYTAPGTTVEVPLEREGPFDSASAVFTVRDHGPGVPASELANIFRPFYRVAKARDRESGGAGLGLAIADRVVRLHGGNVTATNLVNAGLKVQIRIPVGPLPI